MGDLCINCGKANLRPDNVRLSGVVRSQPYEVEMLGLKCPNCGHSTVDAKGMTEFSRLLSDQYRSAHGLLTSDEIVALRRQFKESQEAFADRVGVGVASIKRWELGKIQDKHCDDQIREKTKPRVTDLVQYSFTMTGCTNGSAIDLSACGAVSGTTAGSFGTSVHSSSNSSLITHSYSSNDQVSAQMIYGSPNSGATAEENIFAPSSAATALACEIIQNLQLARGCYGR